MKKELEDIVNLTQHELYNVVRDGLKDFYLKSEKLEDEKASRKANKFCIEHIRNLWVEMKKTGKVPFQVFKYQNLGSATVEYFTLIPNVGKDSVYQMKSNLRNMDKVFELGKVTGKGFVSSNMQFKKEHYGELNAPILNEIFNENKFKKIKAKKKIKTM